MLVPGASRRGAERKLLSAHDMPPLADAAELSTEIVYTIAVSPCGRYLFAGTGHGKLHVWRLSPPPDVSDPLSVPRTRVYRLAPHSEHDPRYLVAKPVEAVLDDTAIGDEDVAATVSASLWSTLDARGAFVVVAPPTSARDELSLIHI